MNVNHAIGILRELKNIGVNIAIDDFGTRYSSLHYLKEFPVDRLKIDQSFIRDMVEDSRDAAIVSMIVSMAKHLHIGVIAEGVERYDQLNYLVEQDCHLMQGYLFSPQVQPEQFNQEFENIKKRYMLYTEHVFNKEGLYP